MTVPTHMHSEIQEIPLAIERLINSSDSQLKTTAQRLQEISPNFIATIARGSSDHAAHFLKYAIEMSVNLPVASLGPSLASIYGCVPKMQGAAAIAISQSGKSPDIIQMAHNAKLGDGLTIALVNSIGSPLAQGCDYAIDICAGHEKSIAATKSFVNSIVAGLAILGHWSNETKLLNALQDFGKSARKALNADLSELTKIIKGQSSIYIIGRGPTFAIANEVALKFKETCGIHAEAYSGAEVMHGPLELVSKNFPVLILANNDETQSSVLEAAAHLRQQGANTIIVSPNDNLPQINGTLMLKTPETGHRLTNALATVIPVYEFIEAYARHLGRNPDMPMSLKKETQTV